jgi:hypothetical protein
MSLLPTSPLWPPQRLAPNALPYGVHAKCFDYCPPVPPCQLHYFPSCLCTYVASPWPPATWSGEPGATGATGAQAKAA